MDFFTAPHFLLGLPMTRDTSVPVALIAG